MKINKAIILHHYLCAAIWTEELDEKFDVVQFTKLTVDKAKKDIDLFIEKSNGLFDEGTTNEQIGHDLWLSRNGHGAGFFDRNYNHGDKLQEIARSMEERNVFVENEGIYIE